jgi:threonine/homoserine/homoserine lactone efflux protein
MEVLLILLLTLIISFIGSVQLGPVNITVIRSAIQRNYKSAIFIGLGGALPELIYSALALRGANFLEKFPLVIDALFIICIPLFIGLGIYILFKNSQRKADDNSFHTSEKNNTEKSTISSIGIGFGIGLLNPMLLPFWMVVLSMYHQYNLMLIPSKMLELSFVLGTALGAFLLQFLIVVFLRKFNERFEKWLIKYANPLTAWMFILLGIVQLINYLVK